MNRWVTIVGAVVLLSGNVATWWMIEGHDSDVALRDIGLQVSRTLDAADALESDERPWPPTARFLGESPQGARARVASALRRARPKVHGELHGLLALVLLESYRHGDIDERQLVATLPEVREPDRSALEAAYPGVVIPKTDPARNDSALTSAWALDTLEARTAEVAEDPSRAAAARARIVERAEGDLSLERKLAWASFALEVAGLLLGGAILFGAVAMPRFDGDPGIAIPPWAGAGVVVRALLISEVFSAAGGLVEIALVGALIWTAPELIVVVGQLVGVLGFVAALAYANGALLRSTAAIGLRTVAGLRVQLVPAAALGLAVFAVTRAAEGAMFLVEQAIRGEQSHRLPQVHESGGLTLASNAVEMVIAAPIAEEILFRGILFGSLRGPLGFLGAATVSGLAFCAMHQRDLDGYVFLFAWTVLYAFVYERTRSLLPLMLSHALGNLFALAGRF